MNTDIVFWSTFLTVFTIWFLARVWIRKEDRIYKKKVLKSLEKIGKHLGYSEEKNIGLINKQISETLNKIKQGQRKSGKK